jgi:hypothetical protein
MNKKNSIILASVLFLALFVGTTVFAGTSYFNVVKSATATTTTQTLFPGGSSYTLDLGLVNEVDQVNLNLMLKASTTASQLNWAYQYSNNNIDWYTQDIEEALPSASDVIGTSLEIIPHSSATVHTWIPANSVSSTTLKNVKIKDINAGYMRVVFSVPEGTGTSTLYAEANLKRLPQ